MRLRYGTRNGRGEMDRRRGSDSRQFSNRAATAHAASPRSSLVGQAALRNPALESCQGGSLPKRAATRFPIQHHLYIYVLTFLPIAFLFHFLSFLRESSNQQVLHFKIPKYLGHLHFWTLGNYKTFFSILISAYILSILNLFYFLLLYLEQIKETTKNQYSPLIGEGKPAGQDGKADRGGVRGRVVAAPIYFGGKSIFLGDK